MPAQRQIIYNGSSGHEAACAAIDELRELVRDMDEHPTKYANYEITLKTSWRRGQQDADFTFRLRTKAHKDERVTR